MTHQQEVGLVQAMRHWLAFQLLCGRDMLFSEAYLSQPIAEYLLNHHAGRIEPEFTNSNLSAGVADSMREIDFALLPKQGSSLQSALEAKWIADTKYRRQSVVDDLLRLECIRGEQHVARYFIVAGRSMQFRHNFQKLDYNDDQKRRRFTRALLSFSLEKPVRTIDVASSTTGMKKFFRSFQSNYQLSLPRRFKTRLVSYSIGVVSVYMWKVESNRNRATFDISE